MTTTADIYKRKVANAVFTRSLDATFILGIVAILLSLGFYLSDGNNSNYAAIRELMSFKLWGLTFSVYGGIKLARLLFGLNNYACICTSAIGVWLWTYVFFSFTIFDPVPMAPTEIMLLTPVLLELWTLVSIIYFCGTSCKQGKK